ncbi:hypothetical protein [Candidatus Accumulibacter sp. ACC012]|uniref:hypothetical protein n=1 Tax=Candidatus Accumulibacter sp. ACC012 TaxID=2823332 RepID=UPI0025C0625C|nr:hypothetical protein [Candidatus Accumulibacter sp. ACC012]
MTTICVTSLLTIPPRSKHVRQFISQSRLGAFFFFLIVVPGFRGGNGFAAGTPMLLLGSSFHASVPASRLTVSGSGALRRDCARNEALYVEQLSVVRSASELALAAIQGGQGNRLQRMLLDTLPGLRVLCACIASWGFTKATAYYRRRLEGTMSGSRSDRTGEQEVATDKPSLTFRLQPRLSKSQEEEMPTFMRLSSGKSGVSVDRVFGLAGDGQQISASAGRDLRASKQLPNSSCKRIQCCRDQ